ncbi:MAG TPA: flagellar assembly protein FliW, partial [bacterium]|nr:flagellar assembly protein FliW [bacterium]
EGLDLTDPLEAKVLAIVVVPSDPQQATMNLKGPLVINPSSRHGKQIVLADPRFSTQHPIWPQASGRELTKCSS